MRRNLLLCLTSRSAIGLFNIFIVSLLIQGTTEVITLYPQVRVLSVMHDMLEVLEGLGTILVALGVALEERETLMKFLGLYPDELTPLQARVDHHCHGYGLLLLLLGLFVEVLVYVVRMPNLPTDHIDPQLILSAVALCVLSMWFILRLTWFLTQARRESETEAFSHA